ncbi:MAG: DUF3298 domain-containing protein [Salinisphaeraceae bacterium]|nr:DUF3298 domain-containing protein [Salinisphaeraceae bacterium]
MKKQSLAYLACFACVVALTACDRQEQPAEQSQEQQSAKKALTDASNPLKVRPVELKRSKAGCNGDECAQVKLQWLEFTGEPKLTELVETELLTMLSGDSTQKDLPSFADSFLKNAEPLWEAGSRVSIKRGNGRLITLELRAHQYTGGAHALPLISYLNIDRQSRQALSLSDVLKADAEPDFWQAARKAHQRWLDSEPQGFKPIAAFSQTDNFFIGGQAVELRYNVYTLGPYAMGQPSLYVPCEEVRKLLRPNWAALCGPAKAAH